MTQTLDGHFPLHASLPEEISSEDELPRDREFRIEAKHDGHRVLVDYRGDSPKILNRKGDAYGARPFTVNIPVHLQGLVVDGEYIPACHGYPDQYIIFDCLWDETTARDATRASHHPLYRAPIGDRMHYVHRAIGDIYSLENDNLGIAKSIRHFTSSVPGGRRTQPTRETLEGWEFPRLDQVDGIIYKDPRSPYVPGRRGGWFKLKFVSDIDCAVTALAIDSKSNCELSVWDPLTETMFSVGRAATAGKDSISVGSVVTVRFLQFTDGGRLREPRIVQVRDDKSPAECTVSQLIPHYRKLDQLTTTE